MSRQTNVWASTAIALLMTATPLLAASTLPQRMPQATPAKPFVLVQDQPTEEELLRQQQEQQQQEQAPAEPAPEPEAQPEPEPQPEAQPEPQPEPAPEPDQPAQQPQEAPAEQPQPEQPAAEQPPVEAPAEPQPDVEQPAPEQPQPEQPAPEQPQPEQPAPEQPQPEQPAPEQPQPEQSDPDQPAQPQPEQPAPTDQTPAPQAPAEQPPAEPAPEQPASQGEQPPAEQPAVPVPAPNPAEQQPAAPVEGGQQPAAPEQPSDQSGQAPLPENAAPVLDSQKPQQPAEGTAQQPAQPADQPQQPADQPVQQPAQVEPAAPPPTDDRAAQQQLAPVEVRPVTAEQGTRVEKAPDFVRQERPKGADVLREVGDRIIIQLNNQVIVESNDRPRMSRGARDVYYEDLPRGRTRETIVRENGVEIVTIRNRYGDVVRRSRIAPDGTEYILAYVDDEAYEDYDDWRDPGDDLPPMRLTVPVEDYILDAGVVDDPDRYYTFLDQPPVERVERLYSVDEVKRSARIRDKTRRVDLDTITFEFGSASIAESEVSRLEGVANAMEKLLKKNPAETFLIEGHTDAVGTDVANLALSDRRAEGVADALTNVFGIPPENLATQGYGERYLKIRSDKPERENRRVAIRRITPLVAPVASAKN